MKYRTVYIATGNPSKLSDFKTLFSWVDPNIQVEMVPTKVEVEENGKTIEENSKLKALPYEGLYQVPVIANDFELVFDEAVEELQDSAKLKRNALGNRNEKDLTQEEIGKLMLEFYKDIAAKHGGKIRCVGRDCFTMILPNGNIQQELSEREYFLVNRDVATYDIYHPLNSLRLAPKIGKFIDEFSEDEAKLDTQELVKALKNLTL